MKVVLTLLAVIFAALPAAAQHRAHSRAAGPAPWAARADTLPVPADTALSPMPRRARGEPGARIVGRSLVAGGGMVAGFFGGAFAGVALDPDTGDDDLDGLIFGALAGAWAGTALGAAIPEFGGSCSMGKRFVRGALGAVAGAAAGGFIEFTTGGNTVPIVVPAAIALGAGVGAEC